jgi:hypothetical protein
LNDVEESFAFEQPSGQHNILELLWHMITWREFTINRLQNNEEKGLEYFEQNNWRNLDHNDKSLWSKGLKRFDETQIELVEIIQPPARQFIKCRST